MLQDELKQVMKQVRAAERVARQRMEEIDRQVVEYIVGGLIDDLQEQYADLPEVVAFLEAVQKDIQENPDPFRSGGQQQPSGEAQVDLASVPWLKELPFRKYQVNVLIDNSRQQGAPVVVEYNPTYPNLFGRIEKETHFGALYTDFLMIKPGSLHRANGGFLVIEAEDLLRDYFSWDGLKRALRTRVCARAGDLRGNEARGERGRGARCEGRAGMRCEVRDEGRAGMRCEARGERG